MRIIVTGGAGFIGSALIRRLLEGGTDEVLNVDKLTYASDPAAAELKHPRYRFARLDICDSARLEQLIRDFHPHAVVHLAAESHVDRSIDGPGEFLQTNVVGTASLLEAVLPFWRTLGGNERGAFRFHHVSTDEVYGDLDPAGPAADEDAPYRPSSPYSASKAASDHLVRAWHRTYGLPVLVSNCSNNYGPRQFPEKLIPLTILSALAGEPLPVYGDGQQIRDWLYVEDHAEALRRLLAHGQPGRTYNIGGSSERRNIDVVRLVCNILEEVRPDKPMGVARYEDLISFVADRPGHDRRYALDTRRISADLGWKPRETFESGLRSTVQWYVENTAWCEAIRASRYRGERLGLAGTRRAAASIR